MFIEHRFSPVYNMTHIECFNEKKEEIMIKRTKLKEKWRLPNKIRED
jgi:hypothetical protein